MSEKIRLGADKVVFDGQYIQVLERPFENTVTGGNGLWNVVERKTFGNIVAVLPITPMRTGIFIDHFRVPMRGRVIELCAGLCDKPGESEESLARREMLEETGYSSKTLELIMRGPITPGLCTEMISIYVAWGAVKVAEQTLEDGEDIELLEVPMHKAGAYFAREMQKRMVDVKLIGAVSIACEMLDR